MDESKLTLRGVEIIFANLEDEGFGRSLTIDASDPTTKKAITDWVKTNNIGKGDKAGVPNFKTYEDKVQYSFKINDFTRFAGLNGLSEKDLGFGAKISLVANAFMYDNKFGKGTSGSLSAVLVEGRASTSADADLSSLLGDEAPASDEAIVTDKEMEQEIDLSDIPF